MDQTSLLLMVLFGAIGMGWFVYGKKAPRLGFVIAGIALMVFPYVVSNVWTMGIVGAALTILPFFIPF